MQNQFHDYFETRRMWELLKRIGVNLFTAIAVLGICIGQFYSTIAIAANDRNDWVGAALYIMFSVGIVTLIIFIIIASGNYVPQVSVSTVCVVFVFLIIECSIAASHSYTRAKNEVERVSITSNTSDADILNHINHKQTLLVDPSAINKTEFGEFVDLSGGGYRVYRLDRFTSAVVAMPVVESQDGLVWLSVIPQDWTVPITLAINDLRTRFPNTTLQSQVVAVTGTKSGRAYLDADRKLDQTELSFWIGMGVFGCVMFLVIPVITWRVK